LEPPHKAQLRQSSAFCNSFAQIALTTVCPLGETRNEKNHSIQIPAPKVDIHPDTFEK
jgi:hypothetical protein